MSNRRQAEMVLAPGRSYQVHYKPGNPNNHTVHIRAIVDADQYVCRRWSPRKGWMYSVEHVSYFEFLLEKGLIRSGRSSLTTGVP